MFTMYRKKPCSLIAHRKGAYSSIHVKKYLLGFLFVYPGLDVKVYMTILVENALSHTSPTFLEFV